MLINTLNDNNLNVSIRPENGVLIINTSNLDFKDYKISTIDLNNDSLINYKIIKVVDASNELTFDEFEESVRITKDYVESNKSLPEFIEIGSKTVSMYDLLYLLCESKVNNNSYFLGNFNGSILSSIDTNCYGKEFTEEELDIIARSILNFYKENNRAPSSLVTTKGDLVFEDTINLFINNHFSKNKLIRMDLNRNMSYVTVENFSDLYSELTEYDGYDSKVLEFNFIEINVIQSIFINPNYSNIVINGNGKTIRGGNNNYTIVISNQTNVEINNVIFNYDSNPLSLKILNYGNLTILDSNFFNFNSTESIVHNTGILNLSTNWFYQCYSNRGTVSYNRGIITSFANSYECIFAKDYGGVFVNLGTLNSSMDFVQGCGADIVGAFTYTFNNSISVYSNMFKLCCIHYLT